MAPGLRSALTQIFPPKPTFTEKDVPNLSSKVYIVTGANTGVGKELARMLYSKNANVYVGARSAEKSNAAIEDIKKTVPNSTGQLIFLQLDLADLSSIKATTERFLAAEPKLHVLFNNAGVLAPGGKTPQRTPQGHELHMGVNCLGTFLLTRLLTPRLVETAKAEKPGGVRVIWVASSAAEIFAQKDVGIVPGRIETLATGNERYWESKVGNWAHGVEYARRHRADGIVSVPLNPGNLQSDLYRDQGWTIKIASKIMMYPPVSGAYTELFAGLSPEIKMEDTGCWVIPFGRVYPVREDMNNAVKTESEGGTGGTLRFWEWTEEQVRAYL